MAWFVDHTRVQEEDGKEDGPSACALPCCFGEMGEFGNHFPTGLLVREKHPDRGEVRGPVAGTDISPVDDGCDLSLLNQYVPGMQVTMYPGRGDVDERFDAFVPLLADGVGDQAGAGFYSF